MNLDLTGKTALVTGSTRGIGLATAIGLAQMGAEVIVNGRAQAAVSDAAAKVRQAAPAAEVHSAALDLLTQPWPLQAFMPLQSFLAVMHSEVPLQLLTPTQCTAMSAAKLAGAVNAPMEKMAAAAVANAIPVVLCCM